MVITNVYDLDKPYERDQEEIMSIEKNYLFIFYGRFIVLWISLVMDYSSIDHLYNVSGLVHLSYNSYFLICLFNRSSIFLSQ